MIITTVFSYPEVGGLTSHVKNLVRTLSMRGENTKVVSWTDIRGMLKKANKCMSASGNFLLGNGGGTYYNHLNRVRLLTGALRPVFGESVVVSAQDSLSALAVRAAGFNGRLMLTVHGYFSQELRSKGKLSQDKWFFRFLELEAKGFLAADKIITVDSRICEYVKGLVPSAQIEVLFNAPDRIFLATGASRLERSGSPQIKLLLPRRLTAKNGVLVAVDIVNELIKRGRDVHLTLAGDGELRNEVYAKLGEMGLTNRATFLGNICEKEIIYELLQSDIVIIPSVPHHGVIEATSIAALEAMASGVPVVASGIGGLAEVIRHDTNGRLATPGDAEEFAEQIIELVDNRDLYSRVSSNAREFAMKRVLDWEAAMYNIYKE